jgi:hypothetical protein
VTKHVKAYDAKQWTAGAGRVCLACLKEGCIKGGEKQWGHHSCGGCKKSKPKRAFSRCAVKLSTKRARCNECLDAAEQDAKRVNTCGSMTKKG